MELKKCKKCGQDNYLDMKFCTGCGNKFEDEDIDIKSDSTDGVYCANCGSKNDVNNKFCESCGSPLDVETEEVNEEEPVQEVAEIVEESKDDEEILETSSDVIYCENCGSKNDIDNKFCESCGSPLEVETEEIIEEEPIQEEVEIVEESPKEEKSEDDEEILETSSDVIYCENCGSKNDIDNKFCESCGSPLDTETEEIIEEESIQEEVETVESSPKEEGKSKDDDELLETSSDVIYCENCDNKNDIDNKFCESCGSPLEVETEEIIEEEPIQEEVEIVEESPKEEKSEDDEEILEASSDVIYCENCGSKNDIDNKFCESCGSPLDTETEEIIEEESIQEEVETVESSPKEEKSEDDEEILETSSDVIYCENCGSKNDIDNKFCESCGSPLEVETEEIIEEEPIQEEVETVEESPKEEEKSEDDEEKQDDKPVVIKENINNEAEKVSENKPKSKSNKNNTKKVKVSNKKKKLIILIIIILVFSISTVCFTTYQSKHNWSKWVSKLPTNVTESKYIIEEKKQYSIKTKKTTTSDKETLKGWTLDKSNLPNTEELEKEVSSIEEIKKFESDKDITITNKEVIEEQYEAVLCGYYSPNETSNRFYIPNSSKPYCDKDDSYTLTETVSNQPKDTYKIGDDYKDKYYTNTDGNKIYYKIVSSTPVKVKYKYNNKTTDNLYHFYKWTEWSEYSDKEQKESSTVKVRERTVYRYKVK